MEYKNYNPRAAALAQARTLLTDAVKAAIADGTLPEAGSDSDWWNMVYRWTDCPVLAGLDLGDYYDYTAMDSTTGTNQSVLAGLYVGRRGVWDENQVETYASCAELWDALTAGAVSTAAE